MITPRTRQKENAESQKRQNRPIRGKQTPVLCSWYAGAPIEEARESGDDVESSHCHPEIMKRRPTETRSPPVQKAQRLGDTHAIRQRPMCSEGAPVPGALEALCKATHAGVLDSLRGCRGLDRLCCGRTVAVRALAVGTTGPQVLPLTE